MNISLPSVPHLVKRRLPGLPMFSWALYDFANTIFAMNVLSLYFVLWVTQVNQAPEIVFSFAISGSMLAVALTAPMFGAVSDRYGRRIPFLIAFALICVIFTAAIGQIWGLVVGLLLFAIANFAYQSGNVFYDSLLSTVSREENRGRISGLGIAMGYIGSILGILMVAPFVNRWGTGAAFIPTAVLFLVFALPCFFFVKEAPSKAPLTVRVFKEGYAQLFNTLRRAKGHSNLLRFIGARFLYVDAVNTLLTFMALYVIEVVGFSQGQARMLFIVSTTFAVAGSFIYGRVVDWIGPKKTLVLVLSQWAVVFITVAATSYQPAFWVLGALAGVALGGTWTADRAFLTRLAPPERVGEFFGLYQLAGRFAAVIGPLLWGGTTFILEDWGLVRFRIAILVLLVNVVLGFILLMTVREQQAPELQPSSLSDPTAAS
jgi:MFS transporter, UMF1 family